jgi:hypothetical protein
MTSQNPNIKESLNLFTPFTNSNIGMDSQDDIIESRLQKRQQNFINSENFKEIKESTMSSELSLGENSRSLLFKQRRLKQNIINKNEILFQLKDKLSIPLEWYEKCESTNFLLSQFPQILAAFKNNSDINQKFFGLVGIKKILMLQESPLQDIVNEGIIPELILLLDLNLNPEFQYEALFCLTFITSKTNEEIGFLIIKQGIKKIVMILDSLIEEIKIQGALLIGNLAINSYKIRDSLIKEEAYNKLLISLRGTNNKKIIKNNTWAISNFFRVKPLMMYDNAKKSIKIIARNIFLLKDDLEFLNDACFILCFITENYKEGIKELMELEILESIINLLDCKMPYIQITTLRLLGNIATGNANQTQELIDSGLLPQLKKTIFNQKKIIRKESAWILSNIAAGTQKQIENLINEDFLLIFEKVIQNDESEVRKECIWAMCNLTSVKNPNYIKKILQQGILECIKSCLMINDAKNLAVNLEALNNLLFFGKQNKINNVNPVAEEIERLGMIDLLENLQSHPVEIVYEKTLKLLLDYFDVQYNE